MHACKHNTKRRVRAYTHKKTLAFVQVGRLVELLVAHGMDPGSVEAELQQVEEETGWGGSEGEEEEEEGGDGEEGEGVAGGEEDDLT